MSTPHIVLGIETSCDETSVALLRDGTVLVNAIYTQAEHERYGGVVPEIASRAHIAKIDRLCLSVLSQSAIGVEDLSLIAVTDSPGLAGALLVGIGFALGIHCGFGVPIIGVNHLEGHIASVKIENEALAFPFLALVVSGGHTALYHVDDFAHYRCLGQTIDDAAGEAFDKVGKLLGLGYPAGQAIEAEAGAYDGDEIVSFPVARVSSPGFAFSFSGLKTAVKYHIERTGRAYAFKHRRMLCRSFQNAVIESLVHTTIAAARYTGLERIAVVGGVARNRALRAALAAAHGGAVFFPSPSFCTDNAAMIAKAGFEHYRKGIIRFPKMTPSPALRTATAPCVKSTPVS